jgi:hypothetical protein
MTNILTNKHLIVALIVSPILAFIAYYAVDYTVGEKPHEAIEGQSYPLVAKSNCRYESGKCTFNNGDISVTLIAEKTNANDLNIQLESDYPIQGARIALSNDTITASPEAMTASDNSQTQWQVTLPNRLSDTSRLQLVLSVNQSLYFGETTTVFTTYKTGFSQENIQEKGVY